MWFLVGGLLLHTAVQVLRLQAKLAWLALVFM